MTLSNVLRRLKYCYLLFPRLNKRLDVVAGACVTHFWAIPCVEAQTLCSDEFGFLVFILLGQFTKLNF